MRHLLATLVLVACSVVATSASAKGATMIGVAFPLSGEFAPVGKQLVQSARLAAREVHVTLIEADSEGTPEGAARAVSKLAEAGVDAIIGPVGRRETMAAAATAQRLGVPLFSVGGDARVEASGGWVFRLRWSVKEQAVAAADNALKHGTKSVAIAFPENEFGREAATAFARRFVDKGGTIGGVASYPTDMTNYTAALDELVGKRARIGKGEKVDGKRADRYGYLRISSKRTVDFDGLFVPDVHTRVARLLPFLPTVEIQNGEGGEGQAVQLYGLGTWRGKAMELSGGVAAGALILDTYGGEAYGGRAEEFSRTFEGRLGRRPTSIEAEVFDGVWLVGSIARKLPAGDAPSRRRVIPARLPRQKPWEGVAGRLSFSTDGGPIREPLELRFDVDGVVIPTQ